MHIHYSEGFVTNYYQIMLYYLFHQGYIKTTFHINISSTSCPSKNKQSNLVPSEHTILHTTLQMAQLNLCQAQSVCYLDRERLAVEQLNFFL